MVEEGESGEERREASTRERKRERELAIMRRGCVLADS